MPPKSNHGQSHDRAPHAGAGGFRTHGAEVSAAAHDAPKGHGLGHGQAVSQVARADTTTSTPASSSDTEDVATNDSEPGA
jgi:hypothetical protein